MNDILVPDTLILCKVQHILQFELSSLFLQYYLVKGTIHISVREAHWDNIPSGPASRLAFTIFARVCYKGVFQLLSFLLNFTVMFTTKNSIRTIPLPKPFSHVLYYNPAFPQALATVVPIDSCKLKVSSKTQSFLTFLGSLHDISFV